MTPYRTAPLHARQHSAHALARALLALCLLTAGACAHAASVYQCVDAHGNVAYQDVACAKGAHQSEVALVPQPAIGNAGEIRTAATRTQAPRRRASQSTHVRAARPARAKPAISWECESADGEVFYRHTRCPASVPGDGVVRGAFTERTSRKARRNPRGAWQRVPVHGRKLPRTEACRRMQGAAAATRDGHLRDARVSTYDHLMGRDPCSID